MYYTVHALTSSRTLSAPLASYADALRWVREWNESCPEASMIALRIAAHEGFPPSPMFSYVG